MERRCIVTGQRRDPEEMVRFVVSPDGEVVPDVAAVLPGRGIWLSASRDVVNTAVGKRLFAKAARARVTVPEDLAGRVEALLLRRCLDLLGLARRAGQAVGGFEKVKSELAAGRVGLLLTARDAGPHGRAKMRGPATGLPVVELFESGELGAALGRDVVVHAAVARGKLARRILHESGRLAGFRTQGSGGEPPERE